MCAETEKERDDWLLAIGRAIVQVSNTYFDEDDIDEIESMDGNNSKFPSIKESDESELIC
ncbi:unnamed protein product [Heterosigma akashiwo]